MSTQVNFTLSTAQVFGLALTLGIVIGIPVGIAAFQYGWSKGAAGDQHLSEIVHPSRFCPPALPPTN